MAGLRILLILPEFPPSFGGMQTHASYLSGHLLRQGHVLEVLTYQCTDPRLLDAAGEHDARCGFPVRRILGRLGYWSNIGKTAEIASGFRPDVIYSSNVYYAMLADRLDVPVVCRSVGNDLLRPWIAYPFRIGSSFLGRPWVETLVQKWIKKIDVPDWMDAIFRAKRASLVRASVRRISHAFANSRFTAGVLQEMGADPARIRVLPGGVDAERFARESASSVGLRKRLSLPSGGRLIMTACRLVPKKGLDFLLKAFVSVMSFMPDAHLVVVGEGRERTKCGLIAEALGISERVIFTGYVPHEEIHHYYRACDVFVLASRTCRNPLTGTSDVETMGRVLCEANASGIPVLASNSGGIPSVITHGLNGLLFEEDDQEDFLLQLKRLQSEPELGPSLVAHGLKRAGEEFDWKIIFKEHEALFRNLPARQQARPLDSYSLKSLTLECRYSPKFLRWKSLEDENQKA